MNIHLFNKIVEVRDNKGWIKFRAKSITSINDHSVRIEAMDGKWFLRPIGTWRIINDV